MLSTLAFTLGLLVHPPHAHHEVFVSPSGSDTNTGTTTAPFRTLERARDAVRSFRGKDGTSREGVTVWLAGGTYEIDRTVEFGPEDSGTQGSPVIYSAVPGTEVRISGARSIPFSHFTTVHDKDVLRRLPAAGRSRGDGGGSEEGQRNRHTVTNDARTPSGPSARLGPHDSRPPSGTRHVDTIFERLDALERKGEPANV